jgi:hypothetical protein
MTRAIIAKLTRTASTITNHVATGATIRAQRSQELLDRYNTLRREAQATDAWRTYCAGINACPTHDGYDLFA